MFIDNQGALQMERILFNRTYKHININIILLRKSSKKKLIKLNTSF